MSSDPFDGYVCAASLDVGTWALTDEGYPCVIVEARPHSTPGHNGVVLASFCPEYGFSITQMMFEIRVRPIDPPAELALFWQGKEHRILRHGTEGTP